MRDDFDFLFKKKKNLFIVKQLIIYRRIDEMGAYALDTVSHQTMNVKLKSWMKIH